MSLEIITLAELHQTGMLPSGNEFELVSDKLGNLLAVSEVDEKTQWRKAAKQCSRVLARIGSEVVPDVTNGKAGLEFVSNMLDADVQLINMSWMVQNNGMDLKLAGADSAGEIKCPSCGARWAQVPLGGIGIHCRREPASGPSAVFPVVVAPEDRVQLPASLQASEFCLVDPTWRAARANVPENHWTNDRVIAINRTLASLRVRTDSGGMRILSRKGEAMELRTRFMASVTEQMDDVIPHMPDTFVLTCQECGDESNLPFALGQ